MKKEAFFDLIGDVDEKKVAMAGRALLIENDSAAPRRLAHGKRRKWPVILAAVLILSSIFGVVSFANLNRDLKKAYPAAENGTYSRIGAPQTRKITLNNNTEVNLVYKQTEQEGDKYTDIYLNGTDEYWFDQDGNFISYFTLKNSSGAGDWLIDKDQAIEIASKHIAEFYDLPEGYEFDYCYHNEGNIYIDVQYTLKYGVNDFISADFCSVYVGKKGQILFSRAPRPELVEGFDESLLDGITMQSLQAYVEQQASLNSEEAYQSVELQDNVWLRKNEDGSFYLLLPALVETTDGFTSIEEFHYPLS